MSSRGEQYTHVIGGLLAGGQSSGGISHTICGIYFCGKIIRLYKSLIAWSHYLWIQNVIKENIKEYFANTKSHIAEALLGAIWPPKIWVWWESSHGQEKIGKTGISDITWRGRTRFWSPAEWSQWVWCSRLEMTTRIAAINNNKIHYRYLNFVPSLCYESTMPIYYAVHFDLEF